MSFGRVMGVASVMVGTVALAGVLSKKRREVTEEEMECYEECVFSEVNRARTEKGLPPLKRDPALDKMGRHYATMMRGLNRFQHQIDKNSVGQRLDRFGVDYRRAAENLQRNDYESCPKGCVETVWGPGGWMASRMGHREAMLDPEYDRAGIGVKDDGRSWHVAMYFRKV